VHDDGQFAVDRYDSAEAALSEPTPDAAQHHRHDPSHLISWNGPMRTFAPLHFAAVWLFQFRHSLAPQHHPE
jgi:hypothetical protein